MAAIRHTLQRDIFLPQDERLIEVVHVITTDEPIQVYIHKVKKIDKDNYKKRQSWILTDLKFADGKNSKIDVPEFDLHFEKPYKWIASNVTEKTNFIACLWKLSQRYLKQLKKPDFINVNPELLEEHVTLDTARSEHQVEEMGVAEDYQALSSREEADLERMMNECEYAIGNAEAFVERLANDLSVLDGANIHSIIESQQKVADLMTLLDESLKDINSLEKSLDSYDDKLERVRAHMEVMEQKDSMIQIQRQNHQKLISCLNEVTSSLDISEKNQKALQETQIGTLKGFRDCKEASRALQTAMKTELPPGLEKLQAVSDQRQLLSSLQETFSKRLAKHLNGIFIHQGNEMSENLATGQLCLPKHSGYHKELRPYSELMQWLKWADKDAYYKLSKVYIDSISKLYERELQEFFEKARQALQFKPKSTDGKRHGLGKEGKGSTGDLSKLGTRSGKLSSLQDTRGSDQDLTGRQKFDVVFSQILSNLNPVCKDEQDFATEFFGYTEGIDPEIDEFDGGFMSRHKKIESLMSVLFSTLEQELRNFISFSEKMDSFFSVFMLVRISHDVLSQSQTNKSSASYLHLILANCLVEVKRKFDFYIDAQEQSVKETKVSKRGRCGILGFVKDFEIFAEQAETVFKGSERRRDLDKAYSRLMIAQHSAIHRVAIEHQKTPRDVVIFGSVTLAVLLACMCALVLYSDRGLEQENSRSSVVISKESPRPRENSIVWGIVKVRTIDNPHHFGVHKFMNIIMYGIPHYEYVWALERLNVFISGLVNSDRAHFFEGVQALVGQGVKEEEVGYQMAFNKQELRKVIKEYPNKEVKKGLDSLYKKVEKTLCEETNLMQVVWHSFQEEFIRQYKHIDDMIRRCYGGSNVSLEFSIEDVLKYFSEIAQSH
ncbi:putative exocyst complex component 1 isoform X5 [Apostichopus japonicus]|uniref:Putative exocyst complex component 1 isoform X5 n=1 Tax=Stichopus japonicus TaxID=307972 RepID=A0A2G8KII7_STIJA|nr:putative exocyst complex component 1 isoform X5 [Apostichopus japonicus]